MKKFSLLVKDKLNKFNKTIKIPGDKSLSIRALILASQCIGLSQINNLLESEDVLNCKKALEILRNEKNNFGLIKAGDIAGKAIEIAGTNLLHSLSYPLTGHYNISH